MRRIGTTLSKLGAQALLLLLGGGVAGCQPLYGMITHDAGFDPHSCADDSECKTWGSDWVCSENGKCEAAGPDAGTPDDAK